MITAFFDALANYRKYRATVRELSAMDDRELQDLGISRYDITRIAAESTFKN